MVAGEACAVLVSRCWCHGSRRSFDEADDGSPRIRSPTLHVGSCLLAEVLNFKSDAAELVVDPVEHRQAVRVTVAGATGCIVRGMSS